MFKVVICIGNIVIKYQYTWLLVLWFLSSDLINVSRESSGEERVAINQVGVALLYHLANKMNDDCRHYPPTRQFFTSCIEILGQVTLSLSAIMPVICDDMNSCLEEVYVDDDSYDNEVCLVMIMMILIIIIIIINITKTKTKTIKVVM